METDGDRVGSSAGTSSGEPGNSAGSKPVRKGREQPVRSPDRTDVQEILASCIAGRFMIYLREPEARLVAQYAYKLEQRVEELEAQVRTLQERQL